MAPISHEQVAENIITVVYQRALSKYVQPGDWPGRGNRWPKPLMGMLSRTEMHEFYYLVEEVQEGSVEQ